MKRAFQVQSFNEYKGIKEYIVAYAQQMVSEHPIELGNNEGPWVRSFMKGQEGPWAAWCNGFVSTCIDLSAATLGENMTNWIPWSWSTIRSVNYAKDDNFKKIEYINPNDLCYNEITKGDLFIVLNKKGTPRHIGIIECIDNSIIYTIEGNTNDEGSREGYELVRRVRNLSSNKYGIIKIK